MVAPVKDSVASLVSRRKPVPAKGSQQSRQCSKEYQQVLLFDPQMGVARQAAAPSLS